MVNSRAQSLDRAEKKLSEIAEFINGTIVGEDVPITGACGIHEAVSGEITFITHQKYLPLLEKSNASAVILPQGLEYNKKPTVYVEDPSKSFLKALSFWVDENYPLKKVGIHPKAFISDTATIGTDVYIGPGAVIEDGVRIGDGSSILANSVIGENAVIDKNVLIYENVTVRERSQVDQGVILHAGVVIGADGFGYEPIDGTYTKVPQTGSVWIQENVEIGANSCVDRARFGKTVIGSGTKIDNLVQVAHNVSIGKNSLIISQVGIAGSSEIGDDVILAGQVGVVGHVKVGSRSKIGAQSGVHTSVPEDSILLGSPPRPVREEKEIMVYTSRLPKLFKEVKEIKKKLGEA